jgi:peptidyl-prolyl cis-trans isomerase D
MTMLDRMRRHRHWLKWSLAIVVLAFILLYIPNEWLGQQSAADSSAAVASVDGREITVGRFRRAYQQQMQAFRANYGGNMDERMLKQLGIDRRIVQQMVEEEAALAEADRLDITVSDAEVQARILALPAFQENGRFIGTDRYKQILNMQNPPMSPAEFEAQIRRGITVEKLQGALTDWVTVSDREVESEFKKRNEKVKLAVVSFPADKFRDGLAASDDEVAKYFEEHKNEYKIPEKRKVRYALLDMQSIRERTAVSADEARKSYQDNIQQYSTPEQVRASHILLKTEGKDDAAVKKKAEELLARAKAGADFAKLATENTDEESGKKTGGDLNFFGKGQMVPEFEQAAFALQPGQINPTVVKTQFGYHVIKVTERKPAATKTFEEVRAQIEDQIKWERAQNEAQRITGELAPKMKKPADLDTVAKARGLSVGESALFSRQDPITGIGMAPAVNDRAFDLKDGEVSEAIRTPQGFVFITVTGKQDPYVPKVDEVKARVREDVLKKKAVEAARQKAAAISAQVKTGDFNAAAKAAGLDVKTTELVARGAAIPDIGVSPAIDAAAFALPAGGVSDPIVTDNGTVIVKVLERKDPTPDEVKSGKQATREELLNERRNRFYAAYMAKAREKMKINYNPEILAQIVG